jgi:hypothetical protein
MKSATTGAVSGCVVWMIVFCVLSSCLLPFAMIVGSLTDTFNAHFVADILGPYLCPQDSTAEIVTYESTIIDSYGVRRPYTQHEMQCVDSNGNVVREPSPVYFFIWMGILAVPGLILSALIAFLLAAPAGVFIVNLSNRLRKANTR